jgi:hypothetical protein
VIKGLRSQGIKIILLSYLLGLTLLLSVHDIASSSIKYIPEVYSGIIFFNATKAYSYAYTLAKEFPYRPVGSDGAYGALKWLEAEMHKLGYETHVQEFTVNVEGPKKGRNIYAIKYGEIGEAIAILGNYDMVPTSYEAASDTAGHVGVLMEIANEIHNYRTRRSVVIVFVDSEEWGMQGARYFVEHYMGPPLKAIIVAEDLAVGNLTQLYLESMGQFRGYSPLWLRMLARSVGEKLGIPVVDPVGFEEYLLRTVNISFTDQGPILAEGISSIEVSTRGDAPELARKVYHTREDIMKYMEVGSFDTYGRFLITMLLSIDMMQSIPEYDQDYIMVSGKEFIAGNITYLPPLILLIPLVIHLFHLVRREKAWDILHGLLEVFVYFVGFAAGFALVTLAPLTGLIPTYDTYPPPPRHPYLYSPNPAIFILFLAPPITTTALLWWRGAGRTPSPAAIVMTLLVAASSSTLFNRFGTVTLLSQALMLWPWIPYARRRTTRAVLLVGGTAVFVMLLVQFGELIYLGPLIVWYISLGVAYGQFALTGNLIFSLLASVMTYSIVHYIFTSGTHISIVTYPSRVFFPTNVGNHSTSSVITHHSMNRVRQGFKPP